MQIEAYHKLEGFAEQRSVESWRGLVYALDKEGRVERLPADLRGYLDAPPGDTIDDRRCVFEILVAVFSCQPVRVEVARRLVRKTLLAHELCSLVSHVESLLDWAVTTMATSPDYALNFQEIINEMGEWNSRTSGPKLATRSEDEMLTQIGYLKDWSARMESKLAIVDPATLS